MPKEGASVKSLSTSIEIRQVFGRTPRRYDESDERYERRQAPRKYFVKLCPEHEKQFNRQQTEL